MPTMNLYPPVATAPTSAVKPATAHPALPSRLALPLVILGLFCCLQSGLAQDTLLFENKWKLPVLIEEENEYEIIYRKIEWSNSPLFVMEKRFITKVAYQDSAAALSRFRSKPFDGSKLDLWVLPIDSNATKLRGRLLGYTDTTLMVRHRGSFVRQKPRLREEMVSTFSYRQIGEIELRRRDQMRRGALWGAAAGFVGGTLTGLLVFNDTPACEVGTGGIDGRPPCDPNLKSAMSRFEKALLLGAGCSAGGFIGGGMLGSVRMRFVIGGKKDLYNQAIPHIRGALN
ncbi:MAG: hypothetical protein KatS3mg030_293 [Saprospiraceae bacterium]|nr:MAG: hypothetical protein KatS3mg030_293 [Saprospiraceae bacterium]